MARGGLSKMAMDNMHMHDQHLFSVYQRADQVFVSGKGSRLLTEDGHEYIDCVGGIATNALGHAHPELVKALGEQASRLWHISNMFRIPGQGELAGKLVGATFADRAFFTNSGSEAVECALKMARRYHHANGQPQRQVIYGFSGAFHGRSYAAINAAGNSAHCEGFGPRLPAYDQLSLSDEAGIMSAIAAPDTAAIILEPVQGEGGAREVPEPVLRRIHQATREHGVLLIYDEVQSGMGRTGRLFAHQWHTDVEPDIMAVAKALGCGFPLGACLATEDVAASMQAGAHGSTFGGNPLAMAVGNAAFDIIAKPATLERVCSVSEYMRNRLRKIAQKYPQIITEIRGRGLLIGVALAVPNREFIAQARQARLLVGGGGDNIVRLLPALNITDAEVDIALDRFASTCAAMA